MQVLHEGLFPSHFNLRLRHIIQAKRFGFGAPECPSPCASGDVLMPLEGSVAPESDTIMASGEFSELEDMMIATTNGWSTS